MNNPFNLDPSAIEEKAGIIRQRLIKMNAHAGAGHTGADLSEIDILTTLYFHFLKYNLNNLDNPDRDRFILSKGHGVGGLYCVLTEAGILSDKDLLSYLAPESHLPGHPVRQKTPGIEVNTGALGHGMSIGCGLALAARKTGREYLTYVLTGDGELEEGSNWEAAMSAAHFRLGNLIVINDRNNLQLADRTEKIMALEPLADKWSSFGFDVYKTDGNNSYKLSNILKSLDTSSSRPKVIIAETIKGKGVSFIENQAAWHHKIPKGEEVYQAIKELE